jgi:hypothetical protein
MASDSGPEIIASQRKLWKLTWRMMVLFTAPVVAFQVASTALPPFVVFVQLVHSVEP